MNVQYLNKNPILYFYLKYSCKFSRLNTSDRRASCFIKYCDALIISSSNQSFTECNTFLCHFVSTMPQQLSQTLFCVEAVSAIAVSFDSHFMLIPCSVAFSLLVQVCPCRMAHWCARETSCLAFACFLAVTSISAFTI